MKKIIFPKRVYVKTVSCLLLAAMVFSACTKTGSNSNTNTPIAALMAFNLVPDKAQGLLITVGGTSISQSALPYTGYTGANGYLNAYTGTTNILAFDYSNTTTPIASSSYTFDSSKYYSIFVVGANNVYSNVIVQDDFDNLSAATGKAYVRYINAIPDSSNPRVTITDISNNSAVNEQAHFTNVSQFVPVTPGALTVTVSNGSTIQVTNTNVSLLAGYVYTVLLSGIPGSVNSSTAVQIGYIENGQLIN
jgi:hypothetical protein